MRILLDNCTHFGLKKLFPNHEVRHASEVGFAALNNGDLLEAAAERFDVLITTDKNIRHQHNLDRLAISIIEINIPDVRLPLLLPLAPKLIAALDLVPGWRLISVSTEDAIETLGKYA